VFGTLIELFDCRKELYTATEVVANQSLFHVVVSLWGRWTGLAALGDCMGMWPKQQGHVAGQSAPHASSVALSDKSPCSPRILCQVEDDDTALRLTSELSRGKCGRVSFMPLNRLKPQEVKYPEQVRFDDRVCSCSKRPQAVVIVLGLDSSGKQQQWAV